MEGGGSGQVTGRHLGGRGPNAAGGESAGFGKSPSGRGVGRCSPDLGLGLASAAKQGERGRSGGCAQEKGELKLDEGLRTRTGRAFY